MFDNENPSAFSNDEIADELEKYFQSNPEFYDDCFECGFMRYEDVYLHACEKILKRWKEEA